jgi:hypothetical protein
VCNGEYCNSDLAAIAFHCSRGDSMAVPKSMKGNYPGELFVLRRTSLEKVHLVEPNSRVAREPLRKV